MYYCDACADEITRMTEEQAQMRSGIKLRGLCEMRLAPNCTGPRIALVNGVPSQAYVPPAR